MQNIPLLPSVNSLNVEVSHSTVLWWENLHKASEGGIIELSLLLRLVAVQTCQHYVVLGERSFGRLHIVVMSLWLFLLSTVKLGTS